VIDFSRTPAAPGTGVSSPRQQINTVPSFIDGFAIYGDSNKRLDWLRNGPVDGTLADNDATLLLPHGYLPLAGARGDVSTSPSSSRWFPAAPTRPSSSRPSSDRGSRSSTKGRTSSS
jgi:hypothetical protein